MDRDDNMRLVTFRVIKVLKRLIKVFCGFHSINSATQNISKIVKATRNCPSCPKIIQNNALRVYSMDLRCYRSCEHRHSKGSKLITHLSGYTMDLWIINPDFTGILRARSHIGFIYPTAFLW